MDDRTDSKDAEFLKRLLATFRIEAREHLDAITAGLVRIENSDPERRGEIIETVYRESHSLKGAARSVNLSDAVTICQAMEDVFSALKREEITLSSHVLDLLHRAVDYAGKLVAGEELPSSQKSGARELTLLLEGAAKKRGESGPPSQKGAAARGLTETAKNSDSSGIPSAPAAAPLQTPTVRLSTTKLDALLLKAEEMLSVKLAAAQRAAELKELKRIYDLWKKERARRSPVPGRAGAGRQAGAKDGADTPPASFEAALMHLTKETESDHRSVEVMVDTLLADMKDALMLPFSSLLEVFPGLVRNLARDGGKQVELTTSGEEIEIDRRVLEGIKDPLIHMVRNCVDHAIETPEVRKEKQKHHRGSIKIAVSSSGGTVEIAVSDDGAGIDVSKVKSVAEKNGVISGAEADGLSDRDALFLVFRSGISTSPIITDVSGRGLGLAIVRERAEKLGGTVKIESQPDVGTTIGMIVPLTIATFRGVLVTVGGYSFILPSTNVERVVRVKKGDILTVENRESLTVDGQAVSLVRLRDVLGLKNGAIPPKPDDAPLQVALLRSAEKRMAFLVDDILHEQEVLTKPLGTQLSRVRNISGATVLGSGKVLPILNVVDLMKSAVEMGPTIAVPLLEGPRKRISVLVAEDSITARTLLKTILESDGYDVVTAVDGADAFTVLKTGEFDLLVSDVDMPRMNGFELTAKIRADKRLSELPVVLVTALESLEDKERGVDAGANAYIVKSSFDQSNLLEVIKRLI